MTALSPVSHRELVKRLRKFGFAGPFAGGKHLFMVKGERRLAIPNPHLGGAFVVLTEAFMLGAAPLRPWLSLAADTLATALPVAPGVGTFDYSAALGFAAYPGYRMKEYRPAP